MSEDGRETFEDRETFRVSGAGEEQGGGGEEPSGEEPFQFPGDFSVGDDDATQGGDEGSSVTPRTRTAMSNFSDIIAHSFAKMTE